MCTFCVLELPAAPPSQLAARPEGRANPVDTTRHDRPARIAGQGRSSHAEDPSAPTPLDKSYAHEDNPQPVASVPHP